MMVRPGPDSTCPAVCGELGSRVLFLQFMCDLLEDVRIMSGPLPNAHWEFWKRLELAASEITLNTPNSGLYTLLKNRTVDSAFLQFQTTITEFLGKEAITEVHGTLNSLADALLTSMVHCEGCTTEREPLAHLAPDKVRATICVQPLLEIFQQTKQFAEGTLSEWGLDDFSDWTDQYDLEFKRNESSGISLLWIDNESKVMRLNTRVNGFSLKQFLYLEFAFFHEWTAHVATKLGGPSSFCDDFCLQWQKKVYLARAHPTPQHEHAVTALPEGSLKDIVGFPAVGKDTSIRLSQCTIKYLLDRVGAKKSIVASLGWEMVGKLGLAAAQVHGSRVDEQFVLPLWRGFHSAGRMGYEEWIYSVLEQAGLNGSDEPFSRFVDAITILSLGEDHVC